MSKLSDDDLMKISIELRRILFGEFKKFWKDHESLDMEKVFFINSMVLSSLISQLVFMLFKKDIGTQIPCEYIDKICEYSKKMLTDSKLLVEAEISFQ